MNFTQRYTVDLARGKQEKHMPDLLVTGDNAAQTIEVEVLQNGAPVDISGAVTGQFIRGVGVEGGGITVPLTGSAAGNVASVTLSRACYYTAGAFRLTITVTDDNATTSIFVGVGNVILSTSEQISNDEDIIPSLQEIQAATINAQAATNAANTAAGAANTAAGAANSAAGSATQAAKNAANAAQAAQTATENANNATTAATAAAGNANAAARTANSAANSATQAAKSANSAAQAAQTATGDAQTATQAANTATGNANTATAAAQTATTNANNAATAATTAAESAAQAAVNAATAGARLDQTAEIVTFSAGGGYPLQITSMIDVTQEGSGTPSADNMRPFMPWTNATLDVAGVNLIPWAVPGKTFNDNGMTGAIDADGAVINGTPTNNYAQLNYQTALLRPGTYTPNGGQSNKFYFNLYLLETVGGTAINTSNYGGKVVALDEPTNVQIKMQASTVANTGTLENYRLAPMLTLADQALADGEFVPYIGQKYTKALGQSVYGGSYNWATGELTITAAHIASYNGEALPGMWWCDRAVYDAGTTPPTGSAVVYELTQPQVVQIGTPQTIQTVQGTNNIWSSTGMTRVVGFGKVLSVNNLTPDENGNVQMTAAEVGARPDTWTPTAAEVGARPDTWTPTAAEVGARPDTWTPTAAEVGALPSTGSAEAYRPIIDLIFYVGRIIQCAIDVNPNTLFPWQTWTQIKDVFLMAAGDTNAVGSTGGEAKHALSIEEMPMHAHPIRIDWTDNTGKEEVNTMSVNGVAVNVNSGLFGLAGVDRGTTTYLAGGNQPHNNLPPYLAVCVWKRTA